MAWHSDNEPELNSAGIIASLSFGATRTFQLKHKQTVEKIDIKLENGSLGIDGYGITRLLVASTQKRY